MGSSFGLERGSTVRAGRRHLAPRRGKPRHRRSRFHNPCRAVPLGPACLWHRRPGSSSGWDEPEVSAWDVGQPLPLAVAPSTRLRTGISLSVNGEGDRNPNHRLEPQVQGAYMQGRSKDMAAREGYRCKKNRSFSGTRNPEPIPARKLRRSHLAMTPSGERRSTATGQWRARLVYISVRRTEAFYIAD